MKEKIKDLEELKLRGLYIIEEDELVVGNNIEKVCKEKNISISNLARITGLSRQNINAVTKNKMKPGIDFALKCSYVLDVPVEELFVLTEMAWIKPYKKERDSSLYLDVVNLEIIDNAIKKEQSKRGYEFYDIKKKAYLSKKQRDLLAKEFVENNLSKQIEKSKITCKECSLNKIKSMSIDALKHEFNQTVVKLHQRLGEKITPYVVSKKV